MKRARGWTVLGLLVAFAEGCMAAVTTTGAGPGSGGSSGSASGGSSGTPGCSVTVLPVLPPSFTALTPGATVRVRASVMGTLSSAATSWTWSATFADGANLPVVQPMASDPALVEVALQKAGSYTIAASLGGGGVSAPCSGAAHFVVEKPGAAKAFFTFRVTPPAGSLPAQQLQPTQVVGGTPTGDNLVVLDAGTPVTIAPVRKSDRARVTAYIRATETSSGLFDEGHATANGPPASLLLPAGRYDLLVVPEGDIPPLLISGQRPVDLATMPLELDDGVAVTGEMTDGAGRPLSGAKVSLRSGTLPSTVGTSGTTGAFALRARPGTYGATIAAGAALPGAEFSVAAAPGIAITTGPTRLSLRLASQTNARIGLMVTGAGANAKVLIEALAAVEGVAMVEIAAGGTTTMRPATMRIRAELAIGADGAVQTGPLPRAHYRATVFAANAAPMMATVATLADIDATAGDVNRTMAMSPPVAISGTLRPGASARLARVMAIDDDAPLALAPQAVAPFRTEADDAGGFSVNVNPSRLYRLVVDPPVGSALARIMLPPVAVAATPVVVTSPALPPALPYAGQVLGPHLEPVGGALVSAYCVGPSPSCVDPTRPIAESLTSATGAFRLALPDPGTGP